MCSNRDSEAINTLALESLINYTIITGTSGWTPRTRALSETTGCTGYTRSGTGTYTDSRTGTGAFSGLTPSDTRGGTTLSYRGTESASFLGDSHDGTGSYTGSPYT
ncbi:hypothetical protein MPER_02845, partial [Moniliophthora perniciosa FA553]